MKNENSNEQPANFTAPGELRIVRILPGPIERVWNFLVDPEKRVRWFAGGAMEPRVGGKVELDFQYTRIAPDEIPPEKFKEMHHNGYKKACTILRWEPPRVLSFTFEKESDVTFELTPEGNKVQLLLTHRSRGGDLARLGGFASGWHTLLAQLVALAEGKERPLFWPMYDRLNVEYQMAASSA